MDQRTRHEYTGQAPNQIFAVSKHADETGPAVLSGTRSSLLIEILTDTLRVTQAIHIRLNRKDINRDSGADLRDVNAAVQSVEQN